MSCIHWVYIKLLLSVLHKQLVTLESTLDVMNVGEDEYNMHGTDILNEAF